jgi:hypothetical protein
MESWGSVDGRAGGGVEHEASTGSAPPPPTEVGDTTEREIGDTTERVPPAPSPPAHFFDAMALHPRREGLLVDPAVWKRLRACPGGFGPLMRIAASNCSFHSRATDGVARTVGGEQRHQQTKRESS